MHRPARGSANLEKTEKIENGPNFLVVGGEKCGTTSLYFYLRQHPQAFVPSKDTFFFNPETVKTRTEANPRFYSPEEYAAIYSVPESRAALARGEVASSYLMHHQEAIPRIKRFLGDIKIVIILRNPVERAYSHYMHYVKDLCETRSFMAAIESELQDKDQLPVNRHFYNCGLYCEPVRHFLEEFSAVKILLFEELIGRTDETLRDLYSFLGIDEDVKIANLDSFNVSGYPRNRLLHWIFFKPNRFKLSLKKALINMGLGEERVTGIIEKCRRNNLEKRPMRPEVGARLAELYRPEIARLEELLGRDLSIWGADSARKDGS